MKIPDGAHAWNVTPKEAVRLQRELRDRVRIDVPVPLERVRLVAGVDVSCTRFNPLLTAGIVVWDRLNERIVETAFIQRDSSFPYVPGLLSFREIPVLLDAVVSLRQAPDVWLVDGHGIAHPRRMGIASHFGLAIGMPTIGVAKSRLHGTHGVLDDAPGNRTPLLDGDDTIGVLVRTKARSTPLIVSPGHLTDQASALTIVEACLRGYRLPEPTRLAHNYVNEIRKETLRDTEGPALSS